MAGSFATWLLRHGLVTQALKKAARAGEPQAQLIVDRDVLRNPYPLFREMTETGPVYQGEMTWVAAQHASVGAIMRSDNFRVGLNMDQIPWYLRRFLVRNPDQLIFDPISPPSMLATNGAQHMRYRKTVSKVLTPRAVGQMEHHIRALIDEQLDAQPDQGVVDIIDGFASLVPVTVITDLLGIPPEMRQSFLEWGGQGANAFDVGIGLRDYRRLERALENLSSWMVGHIRRLKAHPGDDLLSQIIRSEVNGEYLSEHEVLATAGLLLAAGFETTVNLMGNGIRLLLLHRDQLGKLLANPDLWDNAVDEILRYETSIQAVARVARDDMVIEGVKVPANAFIALMIGAANRDRRIFEDPDRFDVTRPNAGQHLSFSAGAHYCVGSVLARMEGRIALRALFERYPDMQLAGHPELRPTATLRGYEHLPVRLGRRTGARALRVPHVPVEDFLPVG